MAGGPDIGSAPISVAGGVADRMVAAVSADAAAVGMVVAGPAAVVAAGMVAVRAADMVVAVAEAVVTAVVVVVMEAAGMAVGAVTDAAGSDDRSCR
ncbi:hypothetical protein [Gluconacetobacter takamatsuzukensis]|uniref:Uncharacterized protein n=1 Tax=Gluconacetobacter takamatsuzukensis TaxID=1286190 RepID=A0A7W4KB28_9PROT|nr:hypothetical protein [Gluconacetobacter takamatsuzukensis]MBB2203652.1 hypothetical protein [Gluconacetobacter takamatsuzukensis]